MGKIYITLSVRANKKRTEETLEEILPILASLLDPEECDKVEGRIAWTTILGKRLVTGEQRKDYMPLIVEGLEELNKAIKERRL